MILTCSFDTITFARSTDLRRVLIEALLSLLFVTAVEDGLGAIEDVPPMLVRLSSLVLSTAV